MSTAPIHRADHLDRVEAPGAMLTGTAAKAAFPAATSIDTCHAETSRTSTAFSGNAVLRALRSSLTEDAPQNDWWLHTRMAALNLRRLINLGLAGTATGWVLT